ncbi:MAG: SAF domain-containing protein [Alphaproteobacteria bacterium]|nr:SAF domain-containing protein [Alphaproteobacteria bacterium]
MRALAGAAVWTASGLAALAVALVAGRSWWGWVWEDPTPFWAGVVMVGALSGAGVQAWVSECGGIRRAVVGALPGVLPWLAWTVWMIALRRPPTLWVGDVMGAPVDPALVGGLVAPLLSVCWLACAPLVVWASRSGPRTIAAAVVAGLGAAGLSLGVVQQIRPWVARGWTRPGLQEVLEVAAEVPAGAEVRDRDLRVVRIVGSYERDREISADTPVVGRKVTARLLPGELLREERLALSAKARRVHRPWWQWVEEPLRWPFGEPWVGVPTFSVALGPGEPVRDVWMVQDPLNRASAAPEGWEHAIVCEPVYAGEPVRRERIAVDGVCPEGERP